MVTAKDGGYVKKLDSTGQDSGLTTHNLKLKFHTIICKELYYGMSGADFAKSFFNFVTVP